MDLRTELEQLLKLHPILSMATIADELRLPLKNVHNLCYRMLKAGRINKVHRKVALADISMAPKPVASLTEPSQDRSLRANDLKQLFLDYNKYVERVSKEYVGYIVSNYGTVEMRRMIQKAQAVR